MPDIGRISPEEAKKALNSISSRSFQLVDVRQIEEYNQHHLPGAIPLPLMALTDGKTNLEKQRPVLLYSKGTNRSLMAARWLQSHHFEDVAVIEGGLDAWNGSTAFGHFELNLNLLSADAEFADAVSIAYAMEEGLRQFYLQLAKETNDELFKELYRELAHYEILHMQELARDYSIELGNDPLEDSEGRFQGQLMEGGGYLNISLIKSLSRISNISEVFRLAQAFETQALDFYYRLSIQAENADVKKFFLAMADSEREHLSFVSEKLDTYLANNL